VTAGNVIFGMQVAMQEMQPIMEHCTRHTDNMVKCEQHCKVPITANALAVKIAKYFETEGVIYRIYNQ
jgi:hypothetical protein